jgi:beta-phosphoglucomutase
MSETITAAIFDVDGVLLASPHEQAWRDALKGLADPHRFTTAMYQSDVAGKPREDGALAALKALGVADAEKRAAEYAENKQKRLEELIAQGAVSAYPDALRFVAELKKIGLPMAVASSSMNANAMLKKIRFSDDQSLLEVFSVNATGRKLKHGKPNPEIFLDAASDLKMPPAHCFVAEDAPAGIEAAKAGGMFGLGVARHHDGTSLRKVGADLVVTHLDQIDVAELAKGRVRRHHAETTKPHV